MWVMKLHKGKTLCTETTRHVPSWLSPAHRESVLCTPARPTGDPSIGQKEELVKGTQMCFPPAGVKIKSKAGKQRGWKGFLRNLQRHFILNRILMIMTSNVMLVPTESTRAIKLKHGNRRTHRATRDPLGCSFDDFFSPLCASAVMGYANGPVVSQSQTAVSWRKRFAQCLTLNPLTASKQSETITKYAQGIFKR